MKKLLLGLCISATLLGCVSENDVPLYPQADQVKSLADQDADGVIHARDLCADTLMGSKIDNDGCPVLHQGKDVNKLVVLFRNNVTSIDAKYRYQVRKMARFLKKYPNTKLELRGYASKSASTEYNEMLSKKRVQSVSDMLTKTYGIPADQLKIVWFGETNPVVKGEGAQVEAQNRRVEGQVTGKYGDVTMKWSIYSSRPRQ